MLEKKTISSIKVRDATINDLEEIQRIERLSFKYPYPTYYMKALLEGLADFFLVAEIKPKGGIIGYVVARIERNSMGHIISIAVDPSWRNRGIGSLLMKEAIKKLKDVGCSIVFLEVRVSNAPAISLYKKLGFKITERIVGYYRDGEDAFIMVKDIGTS